MLDYIDICQTCSLYFVGIFGKMKDAELSEYKSLYNFFCNCFYLKFNNICHAVSLHKGFGM